MFSVSTKPIISILVSCLLCLLHAPQTSSFAVVPRTTRASSNSVGPSFPSQQQLNQKNERSSSSALQMMTMEDAVFAATTSQVLAASAANDGGNNAMVSAAFGLIAAGIFYAISFFFYTDEQVEAAKSKSKSKQRKEAQPPKEAPPEGFFTSDMEKQRLAQKWMPATPKPVSMPMKRKPKPVAPAVATAPAPPKPLATATAQTMASFQMASGGSSKSTEKSSANDFSYLASSSAPAVTPPPATKTVSTTAPGFVVAPPAMAPVSVGGASTAQTRSDAGPSKMTKTTSEIMGSKAVPSGSMNAASGGVPAPPPKMEDARAAAAASTVQKTTTMSSSPVIVPKTPPAAVVAPPSPPKKIVEPAPAPVSRQALSITSSSTGGYMAGLGGTAAMKKNYSVSKWSPGPKETTTKKSAGNAMGSSQSVVPSIMQSSSQATEPAPPKKEVPSEPAAAPVSRVTQSSAAPAAAPVSRATQSSAAAMKKSYAVSKWSPGPKPETKTSGSAMGSISPSVVPSTMLPSQEIVAPAPPKKEVPAEPAAAPFSRAEQSTSSSISAVGSMSGLGGTAAMKKSYAVSKWSPGPKAETKTPGRAMGSSSISPSVLPTITSSQEKVAPVSSPPKEAAAAAPVSSDNAAPMKKKSYSVSKWSPGPKAATQASGSAVGSSIPVVPSVAASRQEIAPASPAIEVPAERAATPVSSDGTAATKKKSYAVSKWSPGPKTETKTSGSSSSPSVVPSMTSPSEEIVAPAPPKKVLPAPESEPPASRAGYMSGLEGTAAVKKSFSVSKWSPGPKRDEAEGSGILKAPASAGVSPSTPTTASGEPPASSPAPQVGGDYMAKLSGSSSSRKTKKYSVSKWSPGQSASKTVATTNLDSDRYPPTSAPAESGSNIGLDYMSTVSGSSSSDRQQKKSYSISEWSPKQTGSSTEATASTVSSSVPVAPVPLAPIVAEPSVAVPADTRSAARRKKKYSMTKWAPRRSVPAGSSSSYLLDMSSSPSPVAPAPITPTISPIIEPPVSPVESSSTAKAVIDFTSNISESSSGGRPKGSYSISKWSPNQSVSSNESTGRSSTNLSQMPTVSSSVPVAPTPSASIAEPPVAVPAYKRSSARPKKKYSMSKWAPRRSVPAGSSSSYLRDMSGSPIPVAPTPIAPTISPIAEPPVSAVGSSSKAGHPIIDVIPERSFPSDGTHERSSSNLDSRPEQSSSTERTSGISQSKKSYSVSKWSPVRRIPKSGINGGRNNPALSSNGGDSAPPTHFNTPPPVSASAQAPTRSPSNSAVDERMMNYIVSNLNDVNGIVNGERTTTPVFAPTSDARVPAAMATASGGRGTMEKSYGPAKWSSRNVQPRMMMDAMPEGGQFLDKIL